MSIAPVKYPSIRDFLQTVKGLGSAALPIEMAADLANMSVKDLEHLVEKGEVQLIEITGRKTVHRLVSMREINRLARTRGEEMKDRVAETEAELAKAAGQGRTVTYPELMAALKLDGNKPADRAALVQSLRMISKRSLDTKGVILPVITRGEEFQNMPAPVVIKAAQRFAVMQEGEAESDFVTRHTKEVFSAYAA